MLTASDHDLFGFELDPVTDSTFLPLFSLSDFTPGTHSVEDAFAPLWEHTQHTLEDFLRSPASNAALALTFGETDGARQVVEQLVDGQILPKLVVLPEASLDAQGAYAAEADTIFLAKELFGQPEKLLQVFLEELGHFIDDHRGPMDAPDAPGDEGAIFAMQVLGEYPTPGEIAVLQQENDHATLQWDDRILSIEKADRLGIFTVGIDPITVEFLADAGAYKGQVALFSLIGMEGLIPGSVEFIQEAARRSLSNSSEGYVIINDISEGASLRGDLGERDRNSGKSLGTKSFTFVPGTDLAVMFVPNGTVRQVLENPNIQGSKRPLFSLEAANPGGEIHIGQIRPGVFALEDLRFDTGSDGDFNDLIFALNGVTGSVEAVTNLIRSRQVWVDTPLGRQLFLIPDESVIDPPGDSSFPITDPLAPPPSAPALSVVIASEVAKFTATDSEAAIAATDAARIIVGTQTIYIGTDQVSGNNQNPIVRSFDSTNPANNWTRTDYEVTGADGRGLGLAWDGTNLYGVFSVDGTQGNPNQDFRRAASDAEQAWLRSYGQGGGPKISVLGRIDPSTGELLDAAYLSALLSNGNSNTLTVDGLSKNAGGNLVVSAQSFFSPRRPDGTRLTQITPGSSPFAYVVEITPDLRRVIRTAANGWA
jgi:hypothetical protein